MAMYTRLPTSKAVQKLDHPIGIRQEHIADSQTLLYLQPKYDQLSPNEYTLRRDWDNSTIFTVTGKKYGDTPVREFRNSSGLPLFEAHRVVPTWRRPWRVRLPGSEGTELVEIKTGWQSRLHLTFRDAAATDSKEESEKMVRVEIQQMVTFAWHEFTAWVEGKKVVDIRENMHLNKTIGTIYNTRSWAPTLPPRPVLDVLVAEGFDLSLAALIAVIMSDMAFSSTPGPR
ncbi:hypothetical protein NUU61_001230 [Penicillium alfredii]|uniref:Tubby C-terminal domain-containing protein n=1 Tax=Penicillium alfredii TaxID=1506179 RepID=A0A9W9KRS0_9EURO|nr:uncharacterized protein NUU61_001230 [Penicillium alfredii]KAJ5115471.1 hypothetical protein NUU61_001230 [Penicillium alfredii]